MQALRDVENITIDEVVRRMESHFEIVECVNAGTSTCVASHRCDLSHVLQRAVVRLLVERDSVGWPL